MMCIRCNRGQDRCKCLFVLFYVLNTILLLGAVALAITGTAYLSTFESMSAHNLVTSMDPRLAPITMIFLAIFVVPIACIGCFGVVRECKAALITYTTLLLILFIASVALGLVALRYPTSSDHEDTEEHLKELIKSAGNGTMTALVFVEYIQETLACCGAKDNADWDSNNVPLSCCPDPLGFILCKKEDAYNKGCKSLIVEFVYQSVWEAATIVLVASVVVLAAAIIGSLMACQFIDPY